MMIRRGAYKFIYSEDDPCLLFDVHNDPDDVVIDFYYTRVYDQSGLEAINGLAEKYQAAGKRIHLTHLSNECRRLLDNAGDLVEDLKRLQDNWDT